MKIEEKIVCSIISNTVALHFNEQLKYTSYYSQARKNLLNRLINELKKKELMFDDIEKTIPTSLKAVYDNYYDFIEQCAKVDIHEASEVNGILKAYKKSPDSVLGIAKKILKKN